MNTTGPWSVEGVADETRGASQEAARRSGQSLEAWLSGVLPDPQPTAAPSTGQPDDHTADMRAIAAQLAQMSGTAEVRDTPRESVGQGGGRGGARVVTPRFDANTAIRTAVAEIARRQADLDAHGAAPTAKTDLAVIEVPPGAPARAAQGGAAAPAFELAGAPGRPDPRTGTTPWSSPGTGAALSNRLRGETGLRRAGIGLSSEVNETFARLSRDLHEAIQTTDARPKVDALDKQIRQIGHAVKDLGAALPPADAVARIGEQTREMRDLMKAASTRSVPFDGVEKHVASLEARLGRLAALPGPSPEGSAESPELAETMAEVRALLREVQPSATLASLETRLDDITQRIERGLDARGPSGLIEGLSRRVDEVHASLRSQMAESAVDTRPLEGLVRGLSDRIGQAREASSDFQQLEIAMRDVAAKIDRAASGAGVQGVEAQLARLAERLDRSDHSLKALDGVGHSLSELFSQFEVTRQVAIDAAETAARTAARDTLRAALQNPSLTHRSADLPHAVADQMTRSIDELRVMHDIAERRTVTTLSDLQAMIERLARHLEGAGDDARRRPATVAAEPPDASRVVLDPSDLLIEPGLGRGGAGSSGRAEPRVTPEPVVDEAGVVAVDADGPATFIAAARRAAQAAQASAASTAARQATARGAASRRGTAAGASGAGMIGQARAFLSQRRRPILLGLAALVLLVGALEVMKLNSESQEPARVAVSDSAASSRPRVAMATPTVTLPSPGRDVPAVAPSAPAPTVPAAPALPMFVAGPAKPQPQAPADGIGEGLRSLAAGGDPAAQYEAGLRYSEGRGVARDPKLAVSWFEKAAAQGSAPAEYRLGSAYEKGVGVDRDPALAIAWYGKAADAGNIRAMHNLAVMSAEGAVGKPDYAKAAQWFGKASTFGVRDSQFNLAILYARGLGIEQSLAQSYTWFAIAAAEGDDDAAKKRDEVGAKLDAKTLAAAKAAADAFHAMTPVAVANEVTPPSGGWDAVTPRAPGAASPPGAKVSRL